MSSTREEIFPQNFERVLPYAHHGTDLRSAQTILKIGFKVNRGEALFLGDGAYFYENCLECAWTWTSMRKKIPPAVIKCTISLGKCIDFTDSYFSTKVLEFYEALVAKLSLKEHTRYQIERLTQTLIVNLVAIEWRADTVRAEFHRNRPLIPGGNICLDSHIVVCVRNISKISHPTLEPQA